MSCQHLAATIDNLAMRTLTHDAFLLQSIGNPLGLICKTAVDRQRVLRLKPQASVLK
jgi:hypothetical protein